MKIIEAKQDWFDIKAAKLALNTFIEQSTEPEVKPCHECYAVCPECQSLDCVHQCDVSCPDAANQLSIDPERYPIEAKVVSLVYQLSSMQAFQPCWSCEGHMDTEGQLWKLPQVGFYAADAVYVQLINQHLNDLQVQKMLSYPWIIKFAVYDNVLCSAYAIMPDLAGVSAPRLGNMQMDLHHIAEQLPNKLIAIAERFLRTYWKK